MRLIDTFNYGRLLSDWQGNDENNSGLSWSNAKKTVAAGIAVAVPGDEVWVAADYGYNEALTLTAGVSLYGGFNYGDATKEARATNNPNKTTLDGTGLSSSIITIPSGASPLTVIDGFVVSYGTGTLANDVYLGGGIYCEQSSPTISHNYLYRNGSSEDTCYGGGLYCSGGSPVILNCLFEENSATDGAGIWCSGTALTLINNTIASGTASGNGGGLYLNNCTGTVANNIIAYNSSGVHTVGSNNPAFSHNCVSGNGTYGYPPVEVNYSGSMTDPTDTDGNIDEDPSFAGWDYSLLFDSPCVDTGDDNVVESGWLDVYWKTRQVGVPDRGTALADMGACEYIDTEPPSITTIYPEGQYPSSSVCTCSTSQLYARWSPSDYSYVAPDSGIVECQYAIGESATYPPSSYIVDWTSAEVQHDVYGWYWVRKTGLSLVSGHTYYFYIKARDGAGNWSNASVAGGIAVGCSSPTLEDALRCADGDVISCTIDNLLVTAGTSQFSADGGANGPYHIYIHDTGNGRITGQKYGLRVDFENGTPASCEPGDTVSIKGRIDTRDGERVMIIDLNDPVYYTYTVTDTSESVEISQPGYLSSLGGGNQVVDGMSCLMINDIVTPGISLPLYAGTYNKGDLVSLPHTAFVSYKDDVGKFFYYNDADYGSLSPLMDGNGLGEGGLDAPGVRVDWSWISGSLVDLEVGDAVKVKGLSSSMVLNNEIVRVVRVRDESDVEYGGPTVTYPVKDSYVLAARPAIKWNDPENVTSHTNFEVVLSTVDSPGNYEPVEMGDSSGEYAWPYDIDVDVDYYAFVRVKKTDGTWTNWSKNGHKFHRVYTRIIYPVDGSTIHDLTPAVIWLGYGGMPPYYYGSTSDVRICSVNDPEPSNQEQIVWQANGVSGDRMKCTTILNLNTTYYVFHRATGDTEWSPLGHDFTVTAPETGSGQGSGYGMYAYDRYGRRVAMVDSRGITKYEYDIVGRLEKVTEPDGKWIAYGYDNGGNRTSMTVHLDSQTEHVTGYSYYDNGLLHEVTDQLNGVTHYTYYDNGLVDTVTYPNGTYAKHTYSDRNWLVTLDNLMSDETTVIANFTYEYGGANNNAPGKNGTRTAVVEQIRKPDGTYINAWVDYGYDSLYRLTREHRTANGGDAGVVYDKYYLFDAAGNRTSLETKDESGNRLTYTQYAYDDANKMTSPGTLSYDNAGNITQIVDGATTTNYTWDYMNRMIQWSKTGQTTESYLYNADGMRVRKAPSGGTATNFLLSRHETVEEIRGANVTTYVGPGLVSKMEGSTRAIFHADGSGSTRAISGCNSTVEITQAGIYDTRGNLEQSYSSSSAPSFGYLGQARFYADSTGLQYLGGLGYYNSSSGQLLARNKVANTGNGTIAPPEPVTTFPPTWWPYPEPEPIKPVRPIPPAMGTVCWIGFFVFCCPTEMGDGTNREDDLQKCEGDATKTNIDRHKLCVDRWLTNPYYPKSVEDYLDCIRMADDDYKRELDECDRLYGP